MKNITFKKAEISHLKSIIELLIEDNLGNTREPLSDNVFDHYVKASKKIENDKNQYLMIGKIDKEIVATCHLTIMPSLTFQGQSRLQIEAVRVKMCYRGNKIGEKMIEEAKKFALTNDCKILQLTTNKKRSEAKNFYEKLGFEATHEGMKLSL